MGEENQKPTPSAETTSERTAEVKTKSMLIDDGSVEKQLETASASMRGDAIDPALSGGPGNGQAIKVRNPRRRVTDSGVSDNQIVEKQAADSPATQQQKTAPASSQEPVPPQEKVSSEAANQPPDHAADLSSDIAEADQQSVAAVDDTSEPKQSAVWRLGSKTTSEAVSTLSEKRLVQALPTGKSEHSSSLKGRDPSKSQPRSTRALQSQQRAGAQPSNPLGDDETSRSNDLPPQRSSSEVAPANADKAVSAASKGKRSAKPVSDGPTDDLFADMPAEDADRVASELGAAQREVDPKVRKKHKRAYERAYLPAAEELEATPAPAASRWLALLICALFTGVVAWAWFGKVDVVVVAQGKTVSQDKVQLVQTESGGRIRQIMVRDGDRVTKGQPLVLLDPTAPEADLGDTRQELEKAAADKAFYRTLMVTAAASFEDPLALFIKPEVTLSTLETRDLKSRILEDYRKYHEALEQIDRQFGERRAALKTNGKQRERLDKLIPILEGRTEKFSTLGNRGFAAQRDVEQQQIELTDLKSQVEITVAQREELLKSIDTLEQAKIAFIADQRANWTQGALEAGSELERAKRRLTVLNMERRIRTVRAPIDGQVQERSVNTVGGVAQPGETLMLVAPTEYDLHVEAAILNKDVGFIKPGMAAEVKLEAFPFTRYGLIEAELTSLALDSTDLEGIGPVYAAKVNLNAQTMEADGEIVQLTPGMTATVEIKTDQRRIIDFILSPLLRYRDEAGRER